MRSPPTALGQSQIEFRVVSKTMLRDVRRPRDSGSGDRSNGMGVHSEGGQVAAIGGTVPDLEREQSPDT